MSKMNLARHIFEENIEICEEPKKRRRCEESCREHLFKLAHEEKKKYCLNTEVNFCPKMHRGNQPPESTHPQFNVDGLYYTSAFVLGVDKKNLQQIRKEQHCEHIRIVRETYERNCKACFPKPTSKHTICSVCKYNYDNLYYPHILSDYHKNKIRSSVYNDYILELCELFADKHPPEGAELSSPFQLPNYILKRLEESEIAAGLLPAQGVHFQSQIVSKTIEFNNANEYIQNQNEEKGKKCKKSTKKQQLMLKKLISGVCSNESKVSDRIQNGIDFDQAKESQKFRNGKESELVENEGTSSSSTSKKGRQGQPDKIVGSEAKNKAKSRGRNRDRSTKDGVRRPRGRPPKIRIEEKVKNPEIILNKQFQQKPVAQEIGDNSIQRVLNEEVQLKNGSETNENMPMNVQQKQFSDILGSNEWVQLHLTSEELKLAENQQELLFSDKNQEFNQENVQLIQNYELIQKTEAKQSQQKNQKNQKITIEQEQKVQDSPIDKGDLKEYIKKKLAERFSKLSVPSTGSDQRVAVAESSVKQQQIAKSTVDSETDKNNLIVQKQQAYINLDNQNQNDQNVEQIPKPVNWKMCFDKLIDENDFMQIELREFQRDREKVGKNEKGRKRVMKFQKINESPWKKFVLNNKIVVDQKANLTSMNSFKEEKKGGFIDWTQEVKKISQEQLYLSTNLLGKDKREGIKANGRNFLETKSFRKITNKSIKYH